MATKASGIFKQIAQKAETTYGELPTSSGSQLLRRTTATFTLATDPIESAELRTDLQTEDIDHGIKRVNAALNGELAPGSYDEIFAALLKRDFTAVTAIAGLGITITGTGPTYTIARDTGSFLSGGIKAGMVVRLGVGTLNAANASKNLFVVAVTALELTVLVLNGSALVAEGPITGVTVSVPGKVTHIPTTGHTQKSFAYEDWQGDVSLSETFVGVIWSKAALQFPPTGNATVAFTGTGQKHGQEPGSTRYFTSPTDVGTTGVVAGLRGALRINGDVHPVTGLSFDVDAAFTGDPELGFDTVQTQFAGRVKVSGQFTAYVKDGTLPALYFTRSEAALQLAVASSTAAAADFCAFAMSRVKLFSADPNDGEGAIVRTYNFTALLNKTGGGAGTAHDASTLSMQDSQAT